VQAAILGNQQACIFVQFRQPHCTGSFNHKHIQVRSRNRQDMEHIGKAAIAQDAQLRGRHFRQQPNLASFRAGGGGTSIVISRTCTSTVAR